MKPTHEIVTREGLVDLLKEHGFEEWLSSPKSPVITLRRYAEDQKKYTLCIVFPTSSDDPRKCAGFAGMGCAEAGKPVGANFVVSYGTATYGQLYREMHENIEPHCGKII